ncbi:MAG TPA: SAM-dependent methyltransferase [Micropepsaceae bacterium]|nr:SAM-dependent methyltransferase [Micropepsaceae bacterium]
MNTLADEIAALIDAEGPMPVATFMGLALGHPTKGYYIKQDPLGKAGDFITAPEISQMFGELIGVCFADYWQRTGAPAPIRLVELGPGRGTLMADMIRAMRVLPQMREALSVHLVETSPALRERQRASLDACGQQATWHNSFDQVPDDAPLFLVANEFFDALPVTQFACHAGKFHLRTIANDGPGRFRFALSAAMKVPQELLPAQMPQDGDILETCPPACAITGEIARRIAKSGGIALIIDYGHEGPAFGDTLQAVRQHQFAPVLETPGDADLTAHVDFTPLKSEAQRHGCIALGTVTQGKFLRDLGLEARAARLAQAHPESAQDIAAARSRLMDDNEMGRLFKVMAIIQAGAPSPAGFAA